MREERRVGPEPPPAPADFDGLRCPRPRLTLARSSLSVSAEGLRSVCRALLLRAHHPVCDSGGQACALCRRPQPVRRQPDVAVRPGLIAAAAHASCKAYIALAPASRRRRHSPPRGASSCGDGSARTHDGDKHHSIGLAPFVHKVGIEGHDGTPEGGNQGTAAGSLSG